LTYLKVKTLIFFVPLIILTKLRQNRK